MKLKTDHLWLTLKKIIKALNKSKADIQDFTRSIKEKEIDLECIMAYKKFKKRKENRKRTVYLDGQNIAFETNEYNKPKVFKAERIRTMASYFVEKHHEVVLMIPQSRKWKLEKAGKWNEVAILADMEMDPHIKFMYTPSFQREDRSWDCYDDSFILKASTIEEGIVVSNDKFNDIYRKTTDEQMKKQIKDRSLPFMFYKGKLLLPDDPCGKDGPSLKDFLCFPSSYV